MKNNQRVACDCKRLRIAATYEIGDGWLNLKSPLGTHRVRLGISSPRKLAAQLLKNICNRASADELMIPQPRNSGRISYKIRANVETQRDQFAKVRDDDPEHPKQGHLLNETIEAPVAIGGGLLHPLIVTSDPTNA